MRIRQSKLMKSDRGDRQVRNAVFTGVQACWPDGIYGKESREHKAFRLATKDGAIGNGDGKKVVVRRNGQILN